MSFYFAHHQPEEGGQKKDFAHPTWLCVFAWNGFEVFVFWKKRKPRNENQ